MSRLIRFGFITILAATLSALAHAQGIVPVNAGSYVNPALPNGSIAQGSMFVGFGAGLGPASIVYPSPLAVPDGTRRDHH